MMFQASMLVSLAVMLVGGATYYWNEEYPERRTQTRLGLAVTIVGLVMLLGCMIFLRKWPQ